MLLEGLEMPDHLKIFLKGAFYNKDAQTIIAINKEWNAYIKELNRKG
jgi:hypothetical protein